MKIRFLLAIERRFRSLRRKYAHVLYAGKSAYCPICDQTFRKFKPAGRSKYKRPNAVCPKCAGRERDRVMYQFFKDKKEILRRTQCRVLHIAPESCVVPNLQELATRQYVSGDLVRTDVLVQFDIQALPFSDQSFEIVYCSHVLQAVEDDDKSLGEIKRVLTKKRLGNNQCSLSGFSNSGVSRRWKSRSSRRFRSNLRLRLYREVGTSRF